MMKKTLLSVVFALCAWLAVCAQQFYGVDMDKLTLIMEQSEKLPQDNAVFLMNSTMETLTKTPMAYRKALELAERRLGNPADSLHSEELYIAALQHSVKGYVLGASEKERQQRLLDNALKNRIGTEAANLEFVTPDGGTHRLSDYAGKHVLLYFNDPDCDACQKVKQRMEQSTVIKGLVDDGKLAVVAVYPDDNAKLWKRGTYPEWMVNGWDKAQQIEENELYVMPPALPVFYLLSPERIVLMKNEASLTRMENALGKVMASGTTDAVAVAKMLFMK